MQEAGKKFSHLVQFNHGQPVGDFTYTLYNQNGTVVVTNTVPIVLGQLSYVIALTGTNNTMTKPLFEQMRLEWEYATAIEIIADSLVYQIHAPIGFPVSQDEVRNMLGVNEDELPDSDIDLLGGFLYFRELVGEDVNITAFQNAGTFSTYKVTKAIEAATALMLFPTMQIRLPRKYDSGTSSYERWTSIDWDALRAEISEKLNVGLTLVNVDFEYWKTLDIFGLSIPGPDPITGA